MGVAQMPASVACSAAGWLHATGDVLKSGLSLSPYLLGIEKWHTTAVCSSHMYVRMHPYMYITSIEHLVFIHTLHSTERSRTQFTT